MKMVKVHLLRSTIPKEQEKMRKNEKETEKKKEGRRRGTFFSHRNGCG